MNIQMNDYERGPIRPPSEADSLLIRTTRGCPWNRCHFCTLFKGARFSIRPVEDIKKDIFRAQRHYQGVPVETCFLQDGDSFVMRTEDLLEVLKTLKEAFPTLKRISSYGRAQTMIRKSAAEVEQICDAGLNMLYSGLESGSPEVLEKVRKGTTPAEVVESSLRARNAGMEMMVFVILGLGGKELSEQHVTGTADILNQINPDEIRTLSLAVKQETGLNTMVEDGSFTLLSEVEMIEEQQGILSQLTGINSRYGNYHSINLLQEIDGKVPEDTPKLLSIINRFLSMSTDNQQNFILGRRLGYYARLSDMENLSTYNAVQKQMTNISGDNCRSLESVFHDLRKRLI